MVHTTFSAYSLPQSTLLYQELPSCKHIYRSEVCTQLTSIGGKNERETRSKEN